MFPERRLKNISGLALEFSLFPVEGECPVIVTQASATDPRFDISGRLICGYKDLIWIVQTEARQIDPQAMLVRHDEMDLGDGLGIVQHCLTHREQCVLNREAAREPLLC